MSPFTEHDFIAWSHAAVRMAGGIPIPHVGLDFDDAPYEQPPAKLP
jgi:hypothetical protein